MGRFIASFRPFSNRVDRRAAWWCDYEGGALTGRTYRGNLSAMPDGDFAADGQTDARSFVLGSAGQTLENGEDPIRLLFVKTNAVVLNHQPQAALAFGGLRINPDSRVPSLLAEVYSIADHVLKQLAHLRGIGFDGGQIAHLYQRGGFSDKPLSPCPNESRPATEHPT